MIQAAVTSVAVQSWRSIEIIVVDDGSTDDTLAALSRWQTAHPSTPLRIIRQQNQGPASARNLGASYARGEFIYFLDSDDLIFSNAIEVLAAPLVATTEPFSVAHIQNTNIAGNPIPNDTEGVSRIVEGSCHRTHWMTHAALYRRETLAIAGSFNTSLRRGEDTEHVWRVLATSRAGRIIPRFIGIRRIHGDGHLSVGRSTAEAARDDLAIVSHFADWAAARHRMDRAVAEPIVKRALIVALRSGHVCDWASHAQAIALLARTVPQYPVVAPMCRLLKVRSRAIYLLLGSSLIALKWLRGKVRSFKSGVTPGHWEDFVLSLADNPIDRRSRQSDEAEAVGG